MLRFAIVIFLLTFSAVAHADGTISGWVHVAGHHYPVHPVAVQVIDPATGEAVPGLNTVNLEDGTYEIANVPEGDYKVHYDAFGVAGAYIDELTGNVKCDNAGCDMVERGNVVHVSSGRRTKLNINLDRGAMVSGRVTRAGGGALEGVTVEFYDVDGNPYCCSRVTDDKGEWARPMFFPTKYYMVARYEQPSQYEPHVYKDRSCSGCEVKATGTAISVSYNNGVSGVNFRLPRVEADPDIERDTVEVQRFSGSWYNPERDGEGFIVEVLDRPGPDGRGHAVVVFWFTYTPEGQQAWMVGSGGIRRGVAEVDFEITDGAFFGADFDPDDVEREPWGSLRLEFLNCDRAHAQFGGSFGSGQQDLTRLSAIEGLDCADVTEAVPTATGNPAYSGAWYNPSRDGEGFIVEVVEEDQVLVYWFTYDIDGHQMWLLGVGDLDADLRARIPIQRTAGGSFGDRLDPENVVLEDWGELTLQFDECGEASYDWTAPAPYESGGFGLVRLTALKSTSC